jgi:hypothetical protein
MDLLLRLDLHQKTKCANDSRFHSGEKFQRLNMQGKGFVIPTMNLLLLHACMLVLPTSGKIILRICQLLAIIQCRSYAEEKIILDMPALIIDEGQVAAAA